MPRILFLLPAFFWSNAALSSSDHPLLAEDWEQYAKDDVPSGTWQLTTAAPDSEGIIAVSDEQASPFQSGGKSLKLTGLTKEGGPYLTVPFVADSGGLVIEFDYYLPSDPGPANLPSFQLLDSKGSKGIMLNFLSGIVRSGKFDIVNQTSGAGTGDVIAPAKLNRWIHVKIVTRPEGSEWGKYDVYVTPFDEETVAVEDLPYRNKLVDPTQIQFGWASPNAKGVFYVDNVFVAPPLAD